MVATAARYHNTKMVVAFLLPLLALQHQLRHGLAYGKYLDADINVPNASAPPTHNVIALDLQTNQCENATAQPAHVALAFGSLCPWTHP